MRPAAGAPLGAQRSRGWMAAPMALRAGSSHHCDMTRDLGLQVRMLLTMFLLGLLYVALVVALLSAGTGMVTMLVIVAGLALAQLTLSDKIALRAIGAREVSPAARRATRSCARPPASSSCSSRTSSRA
jgi:Zn-dependent protease with chaperone function